MNFSYFFGFWSNHGSPMIPKRLSFIIKLFNLNDEIHNNHKTSSPLMASFESLMNTKKHDDKNK